METFNAENAVNEQKMMKTKQIKKIKQVIKNLVKRLIHHKKHSKVQQIKKVEEDFSEEIEDNNANELLEQRLNQEKEQSIEEQQNILNQQHFYKQIVFVENENGTFFWSTINNKFQPIDRELIEARHCDTFHQIPQIQACWTFWSSNKDFVP